ncbi:MAG: hypothetical protein HZB62_10515 [Nitrospirae bacterium]|nr:hypothetical protein [Nitrospirota bacterium]
MGIREKLERIFEAVTFAEAGDFDAAIKIMTGLKEEREAALHSGESAEAADSRYVYHATEEESNNG